ncbi:MAG: hypothetical protein Kow00129_14090 [Thermoleophilia bacterium]
MRCGSVGWGFEKVTHRVVVLGEGVDEANLLNELAKQMNLDIQCVDCGGSQQFHTRLKVVMAAPGFDRVKSLGVVRDAEGDAAGALASIRGRFRDEGLPVPNGPMERASAADSPNTAFIVVPHGATAGMMEDVVLRALEAHPATSCKDDYFACLEGKGLNLDDDRKKREVQVMLSGLESKSLSRSIGEAAKMGLLPLGDPAFAELRDFLELVAG